jgi:uncharacterized protein
MKQFLILTAGCFWLYVACAQKSKSYTSIIKAYQKNYVSTHEVVKGNNRKFFRFFAADEHFKVQCQFEKSTDTITVTMKTSGKTIPQKDFIRYGKLVFTIHDTALQLTVYQSATLSTGNTKYKDYLFIPFTDATTGDATYGSGRYIDILTTDIKNNMAEIDFNKAYNPYCAYSNGFNCPIPPKENYLPVAITAGEKTFAKITGY